MSKGMQILILAAAILLMMGVLPRGLAWSVGSLMNASVFGFLTVLLICHYAYKAYCVHRGGSPGSHARHQHNVPRTEVASRAERARVDDLDKRLARIEEALTEIKRENESLAEDYRFIQRVLEKE
jgi:hypothetical protein